jgi:hypothetical protein
VSTPDLVTAIIDELALRHEKDVFVVFIKRQVDGNRPATLARVSGDAYGVEGAVAMLHRWVKRMNDHSPLPFKGERGRADFYENGPVPGSAD